MFTQSQKSIFLPPQDILISEYAAKYRQVTAGPARGLWTNEYTPYLVDIMDTMKLPQIREGYVEAGPQTGKTQAFLNCMLYWIANDPDPDAYCMPDDEVKKRIMKKQITPMLRKSEPTAALLSEFSRDTAMDYIKFRNGMDIAILHAGSPAQLASESYKYVFGDEVAKWPIFSGADADTLSLLEHRMNAYPDTYKFMLYSTPTNTDTPFAKRIKQRADEHRRLFVCCPKCSDMIQMFDEQIRWPKSKSVRAILRGKLARYECQSCGTEWDDFYRNMAVAKCEWRPEKHVENAIAIAWRLPGWYSPLVSLSKIAVDKIEAGEDPIKMFNYITQRKAEPFKNIVKQKREDRFLEDHKSDFPPLECPEDAVLITAGIDTQQKGFWYVVRAWAEDKTSWLLDYGYITDWEGVEAIVFLSEYKKKSGQVLKVWRALIDTGGTKAKDAMVSRTEEVYNWLRRNSHGKIFGYKGASQRQDKTVLIRNLDTLPSSGRPIPGGLKLIKVNADEIKNTIQWRLFRKDDESQQFFLHNKTGSDYARQFLAQALEKDRLGNTAWVQLRKDDHLKDCEVYAAACVDDTWIPSFSMIVNHLKKQRNAQPKKPVVKNNIPQKRERMWG
jgi:phage terminase large subunit GpA-like protein